MINPRLRWPLSTKGISKVKEVVPPPPPAAEAEVLPEPEPVKPEAPPVETPDLLVRL